MKPNVKSIFVLYTPGYAGNFLIRLLALDTTVVPIMPKKMMIDWVETAIRPEFDLESLYSFDVVGQYHNNDWLGFHLAWSDIYDKIWYESLTDLEPQYTNIVYQIHPYEFRLHEAAIASLSNSQFFYVDLDLSRYGDWVSSAASKIGFKQRGDELADGKLLRSEYCMQTIDLGKILDTDESFIAEYSRICKVAGLVPHVNKALSLRDNWLEKRGPCKTPQ
jgi:hypothetical protein